MIYEKTESKKKAQMCYNRLGGENYASNSSISHRRKMETADFGNYYKSIIEQN